MLEKIKNIVVITGCQRSGSTLVGQIIGAHPDALLLDEPDGLYDWFEVYSENAPDAPKLLREVLIKANKKYRPTEKRIVRVKAAEGPKILDNVTHLVLKAPNLTYDYEAISKLAIPVSVIHLVRDPRAVVASMIRLRHISMLANQASRIKRNAMLAAGFSDEIEALEDESRPLHLRLALVWQIKTCLYERFISHGVSTLVLHYEDLIADKDAACARMASHAGLSPHPNMMAHEKVFSGFGPGYTERSRPVDNLSVEKWREQLNPEQEEEILNMASDAMAKLDQRRDRPHNIAFRAKPIDDDILRSPIILTGRGGSGTRLLSDIAERSGIFIGNRLNATNDSIEWAELIYLIAIEKCKLERSGTPMSVDKWEISVMRKAREVLSPGAWKDGQAWGFKLPETMIVIPELFATFTNAKLIHLVRHPVDCCLRRTHKTSRRDEPIGRAVLNAAYNALGLKPNQQYDDYQNNAYSWLYQVDSVMNFARSHLPPERYLEVRYEDICSGSAETYRKIFDFLGCSDDLPSPPDIDVTRMRSYELPDPRADEVWELCKETAVKLGYGPVP